MILGCSCRTRVLIADSGAIRSRRFAKLDAARSAQK